METAICGGRVALSPNHVFHPKSGDKSSVLRQSTNRIISKAMLTTGAGKGGGVLDRPVIEKTTPGRESEFDLRSYPLCPIEKNCDLQY